MARLCGDLGSRAPRRPHEERTESGPGPSGGPHRRFFKSLETEPTTGGGSQPWDTSGASSTAAWGSYSSVRPPCSPAATAGAPAWEERGRGSPWPPTPSGSDGWDPEQRGRGPCRSEPVGRVTVHSREAQGEDVSEASASVPLTSPRPPSSSPADSETPSSRPAVS